MRADSIGVLRIVFNLHAVITPANLGNDGFVPSGLRLSVDAELLLRNIIIEKRQS